MFIARSMHQIPQSPRGATGVSVAHCETRRGWVPQPIGRGDLAPTMRAGHRIWVLLMYLAPEGRHVYSTRHTPNTTKPQSGDRWQRGAL